MKNILARAASASVAILPIALFALGPGQAHASVNFCNHTSSKVNVVIAYGAKDPAGVSTGGHMGVKAEGWWSFAPAECAQVSGINAGDHWLYYYAHSQQGTWNGQSFLCVPSKAFTRSVGFMRQSDGCGRSERLLGFKRIDASKANYTMNLR